MIKTFEEFVNENASSYFDSANKIRMKGKYSNYFIELDAGFDRTEGSMFAYIYRIDQPHEECGCIECEDFNPHDIYFDNDAEFGHGGWQPIDGKEDKSIQTPEFVDALNQTLRSLPDDFWKMYEDEFEDEFEDEYYD